MLGSASPSGEALFRGMFKCRGQYSW